MSDGQSDMDKRKAEVRRRLEEQSTRSKKKKGFMTPERKKKLRLLLRKKAAEELKKEQERKAAERRRVIDERCGRPKPLDGLNDGDLRSLCKEYYNRVCSIESAKYDIEKEVEFKDYQINELNIAVNDLRGKFIKPTLKKVSKYENKFAKLQKKAAEFNFRNQLKTVKKKEFTMDEEEVGEHKKPDWATEKEKEANKAKAGSAAANANAADANSAENNTDNDANTDNNDTNIGDSDADVDNADASAEPDGFDTIQAPEEVAA